MTTTRTRIWATLFVLALLCILVASIVHSIRGQSLTWDEDDHIFSGYEIWQLHDYSFNPEHPPMVKMLAAIPLLPLHLTVPPNQHRFFKQEAYLDGRELLFRNAPRYSAASLVLRARLVQLVFPIAAALLVFAAATEMFSLSAGIFALLLFCFEPNLLAHGAYVTTDSAAACTFLATIYAFWRWYRRPTLARLTVTGIAGGLALAAKHSTIMLVPMLVLLALAVLFVPYNTEDPPAPRPRALRLGLTLVAVAAIAVTVLWAFYGFRYAARPNGLALVPTLAAYTAPLPPSEAHGVLLLARLHLLPESYLYGLTDVRTMANGMPSYFFGRVYAHGLWYYFPILFLIKSTLGMLALLALTAFAAARGWLRHRIELLFLVIPPALYLLIAMTSHLNIGARHILPIWIFCCVLAGAGAAALYRRSRAWRIAVITLLTLHVASSVHAAPNYIPYANEAWGGPSHTWRYLTDSNADWGQQLVATSDYLRQHDIHQCWFAYFVAPFVLPADYGIPCKLLPTADTASIDLQLEVPPVIQGPVLISAGSLNGFEWGTSLLNPYESFTTLQPSALIQNGILVYQGAFAVPRAAAFLHVQRSQDALAATPANPVLALSEAQAAMQLDPTGLNSLLVLGDAFAAVHRTADARDAYAKASTLIDTMEAGARIQWRQKLDEKLTALDKPSPQKPA